MLKSKLFLSSLTVCILISGCNSESVTPSQSLPQTPVVQQTIPYQNHLSPSIISILNSSDSDVIPGDTLLTEQNAGIEYVKHFTFFTEIDITGSAIEEILAHDGYKNASKYVTHWRDVLGENADWPDLHSTTLKGKHPALEHGILKNGAGWFWYRSAVQKTDEYFSRAVKAWHKGSAPDAPEQQEAWEWLSRTSHFIQDVTLPFHTVTLARLGQTQHTPYESNVEKNFSKYFPSKNYDGGAWKGKGPYPADQAKWGIYFEGRLPGEVIKNTADITRGLFKIVRNKADATNGNWDKVQALTVPMASKTCAGLVVSFLQQVGETP